MVLIKDVKTTLTGAAGLYKVFMCIDALAGRRHGYTQHVLVETAIGRLKRMIGDIFRSWMD
jgi:hypothetical protein